MIYGMDFSPRKLASGVLRMMDKVIFQRQGWCPICECDVTFSATKTWYRDHLLCSKCGSIPRERALMRVLAEYYPDYRELDVHESSPGGRGVSLKLHHQCARYTVSHFYPDVLPGQYHKSGYRCENLEKLTFPDNSFDLLVTQDVMEHIFDPAQAFREIARVLKPGGAHIFTVPIVRKTQPTFCKAERRPDGSVALHGEAEYHGNPIADSGSLVTMHWGYDIAAFIAKEAGMPTVIREITDMDQGIVAEYIDVVVSTKV